MSFWNLFGKNAISRRKDAIREETESKKELSKDMDAYGQAISEAANTPGFKAIVSALTKAVKEGLK